MYRLCLTLGKLLVCIQARQTMRRTETKVRLSSSPNQQQQEPEQMDTLHRTWSMPVESPSRSTSSIFYRNRELSKSSRSIKLFLLRGRKDENEDYDSDGADTGENGLAPRNTAFVEVTGTSTASDRILREEKSTVGEKQPLLPTPKHNRRSLGLVTKRNKT